MGSRPQTPSHDVLGPQHSNADTRLPTRTLSTRSQRNSYLGSTAPAETDFAHSQGAPMESSPLGQTAAFNDGTELSYRDTSSIADGGTESGLRRSNSQMSQSQTLLPSRGGTLKKKASLKRSGSLKRSSSRRSSRAGSVRSLNLGEKEKYNPAEAEELNSAFFSPVPTSGSPTELLANRFQGKSISTLKNHNSMYLFSDLTTLKHGERFSKTSSHTFARSRNRTTSAQKVFSLPPICLTTLRSRRIF